MADPRDAPRRALEEAADDARSGAADIARRAAEALAALPREDIPDAVAALLRAHPSMAPLWLLGSAVLGASDARSAARGFALRILDEPRKVARRAAAILPDVVVTLSYSGTLIETIAAARARALCARSEPGGEGERTAMRLRALGISADLVDDAAALRAAAKGTAVVVGADAVGPGGVVNKVGTAALAGAALHGGAERIVVAGRSKLVPVDLPAAEPFERTPLDRFTAIVTDEAVLSPHDAAARAGSVELDRAITTLLPG